jgi:hypothetical protein
VTNDDQRAWWCPLYEAHIAEGKCLEINYERLGLMSGGHMEEIRKLRGMVPMRVCEVCRSCPNQPIGDDLGRVSFPNG